MSVTLQKILTLIAERKIHVSDHAYSELEKDDILPTEIIANMQTALLVEDYPSAYRGPSVLLKCEDESGNPIRAVWGISNMGVDLAVLVKAYRPDTKKWTKDFLKRIKP